MDVRSCRLSYAVLEGIVQRGAKRVPARRLARARAARFTAIGLAVLGLATAALATAPPAQACLPVDTCGSTVAINMLGGSLTVTSPASVTISGALGSASSFAQTMGTVTVQDSRGTLAGWTLTATTTGDLVTSTSPVHTISLGTSNVTGPLRMTTGVITPQGVSSLLNVTAGGGGALNPSSAVTVASALLGFGGGTYTMTPTLTLTPPANTFAGSYSTTLTFTLTG